MVALLAYNISNPGLQQSWWVGIGLSVLFLLFYFIGRRQSLIMASSSEKIAVNVQGGNKEILERFARKAQEQQVAFLRVIYSGLSQGVREPAMQKSGSEPTATLPGQS